MLYQFFRLLCPVRLPASGGTPAPKKTGFNLIEAAVVLAVVGLVIGGIWYAAASVQQSQRINNTAAGILQIATGARRLFSHSDYPTTNGASTYVASTVHAAGLVPGDFTNVSGVITSPMGSRISLHLSCWIAAHCPMLELSLHAPIASSDCIQLIRRFAGLAKDNACLLYTSPSPRD